MAGNRKRRRQERALDRLDAALADPAHEWKRTDGPAKAEACIRDLARKGVR